METTSTMNLAIQHIVLIRTGDFEGSHLSTQGEAQMEQIAKDISLRFSHEINGRVKIILPTGMQIPQECERLAISPEFRKLSTAPEQRDFLKASDSTPAREIVKILLKEVKDFSWLFVISQERNLKLLPEAFLHAFPNIDKQSIFEKILTQPLFTHQRGVVIALGSDRKLHGIFQVGKIH